jgi:hypothetical protein
MNQQENTSSLSMANVLTLIFITLKLTNFIDWSWWWVLSPTLIPIALIFVIALIHSIIKK